MVVTTALDATRWPESKENEKRKPRMESLINLLHLQNVNLITLKKEVQGLLHRYSIIWLSCLQQSNGGEGSWPIAFSTKILSQRMAEMSHNFTSGSLGSCQIDMEGVHQGVDTSISAA